VSGGILETARPQRTIAAIRRLLFEELWARHDQSANASAIPNELLGPQSRIDRIDMGQMQSAICNLQLH